MKKGLIRFWFLAAVISAFLLASCKGAGGSGGSKDDSSDDTGASYAGVYIVGSDSSNHPAIWNSGKATELPIASGSKGNAFGVALGSGHVYVAGYSGSAFPYTPCVWVDGARTDLKAGGATVNGEACAVAVSGSTVYVAGDAWDDTVGVKAYTPGYWQYSGSSWVWHQLAARDGCAVAVAIDGSGNPVFAEEAIYSGSLSINYWKYEGSAYAAHTCDLSVSPSVSQTSGIGVRGTSIIVVGSQGNDGLKHPCCWTDGARADLTGSSPNAATGVAVSGSDIYIAGVCVSGGNCIPGYWKNGTWTGLPADGSGSFAQCIAISGADVYIAGLHTPSSGTSSCFWKNGSRVEISGVQPNAIAVE